MVNRHGHKHMPGTCPQKIPSGLQNLICMDVQHVGSPAHVHVHMANFQDCPHSDRKKQRLLELRFEVQTISHNEMAEEVKESLPELSADIIPDTYRSEVKKAKSASSSIFAKPKNSSSKSLVENNSKQAKQAEATEDGDQPSTN